MVSVSRRGYRKRSRSNSISSSIRHYRSRSNSVRINHVKSQKRLNEQLESISRAIGASQFGFNLPPNGDTRKPFKLRSYSRSVADRTVSRTREFDDQDFFYTKSASTTPREQKSFFKKRGR